VLFSGCGATLNLIMENVKKMSSDRKGRIGGRDNDTGRFVPLEETRRDPRGTTREVIPLPGHGDSGRYDSPPPPQKGGR
jgi:hypothetical protein